MAWQKSKRLILCFLALVFIRFLIWLFWFHRGWTNEGRKYVAVNEVRRWKEGTLDSMLSSSKEFALTDEWLEKCAAKVEASHAPPFDPGFLYKYSLGDCVRKCRNPSKHLYPYTSFKNEYGRMACPETNPNYVFGGNLTVLKHILDARDGRYRFEKPPSDAVVIHLRLGDIVEKTDFETATLLKEGGVPRNHPGFLRSIYQYVKEVEWANVTKVHVVGGAHSGPSRKSRTYSGCLYLALTLSGYETHLRTDGFAADEDFYYVSHATKLILATGGFSFLMGQMVEIYGGKVVGTNIWSQKWNNSTPWTGKLPPLLEK